MKKFLSLFCIFLITSLLFFNCQKTSKIEREMFFKPNQTPTIVKQEKPDITPSQLPYIPIETTVTSINSIPIDNLTLSCVVYSSDKDDIITGVDILSIPKGIKADLINKNWILLRTHFDNIGESGKLKFLVNNNEIITKEFVFQENNYLDTIVILKGLDLPLPIKSNNPKLKEVFFSNNNVIFDEKNIRIILKKDVDLNPSKTAPPYHPYEGNITLPQNKVPLKIILKDDVAQKVNIEYIVKKDLLLFYSNGDYSSKILIFFQDEEVLIYDLNFEGGMGKAWPLKNKFI